MHFRLQDYFLFYICCFEEIINELLLKNLENPLINVTVEYSEAEETANMIMCFNGPVLDESSIKNELSYTMLERIIRKFNYDQTDT